MTRSIDGMSGDDGEGGGDGDGDYDAVNSWQKCQYGYTRRRLRLNRALACPSLIGL